MASARRWLAGAVALLVAGLFPGAPRADGGGSSLADDATLIALAVALSCADATDGAAAAQHGGATPATEPELELVATVRARTLRFDEVPNAEGLLRAFAGGKASWKAERVNLPARPQPGVVYRDVRVRLTVASDADGLAVMLREAKRAARGIRLDDAPAAPVAAPHVVVDPSGAPAVPAPVAAPAPVAMPTATPTATPAATPTAMDPVLPFPPPPPPIPESARQSSSAPGPGGAE